MIYMDLHRKYDENVEKFGWVFRMDSIRLESVSFVHYVRIEHPCCTSNFDYLINIFQCYSHQHSLSLL